MFNRVFLSILELRNIQILLRHKGKDGLTTGAFTPSELWTKEKTQSEAQKEVLKALVDRQHFDQSRSADDIAESYVNAAAKAYDPHSSYFSPASLEKFKMATTGGLEGIGVHLVTGANQMVVRGLLKGGAAEREGTLKPGDKILSASQDGKDYVDLGTLRFEEAASLLRGDTGTEVHLRIQKTNGEIQSLALTRKRVDLEDARVTGTLIQYEHKGRKLKVGVIDIPSFYSDHEHKVSSAQDVYRALERFQSKGGVDGVCAQGCR